MDSLTRALLVLIAVALCISAAHDVGWIGTPKEQLRYRLVPVPQARSILLQDVFLGHTWRAELKLPQRWQLIHDGPNADTAPKDPPAAARKEASGEEE